MTKDEIRQAAMDEITIGVNYAWAGGIECWPPTDVEVVTKEEKKC